MMASYRNAGPADASSLKELFADSFVGTFGHLYRPADLAAFLESNTDCRWQASLADPDAAIHVAEVDGRLAGFVELGPQTLPYETSLPAIELRRLYLTSSAHGRGIADHLMRWALREAASRGAGEIVLSVYVDNHRARRFYERYGFETVGRYDFMVGNHADEDLILRLAVTQARA